MAAKNLKKKKAAVKVKKKKWHPIYAPKQFNEVQLGETYVSETSQIQSKYLTANLSTIVKSMRKQKINIHFKVSEVKDGKGYTTIIGYSLINAAIKRLVRRGRDKIADSFIAKTKDKQVMRLKPLVITMNQGTKSIQSAIRLEARRVIREFTFTKTTEEVFADIIDGKLQKQIKDSVGKIAPVKNVEMRIAKMEENANVKVTDKEVESEAVRIRRKDRGEKHISEEELKALEAARAEARAEDEEIDGEDDDEESTEDFGEEEATEDFGDDEETEEPKEEVELSEEVEESEDFDEDDSEEDSEEPKKE